MANGSYPGDNASPYDMNRLADFYRDAAHRSAGSIQTGDRISAGPMRLLAIHSVELNLSAFLLLKGASWTSIRGLGHDLAARLDLATDMGLTLRERTSAHIRTMERDREYLIARYGPDCLSNASQVNRLLATLEEVARKVSRAIADAPAAHAIHPGRSAPGPANTRSGATTPDKGRVIVNTEDARGGNRCMPPRGPPWSLA